MANGNDDQESERHISSRESAQDADAIVKNRHKSSTDNGEEIPTTPSRFMNKKSRAKMELRAFDVPIAQEPGAVAVSSDAYRPSNTRDQKTANKVARKTNKQDLNAMNKAQWTARKAGNTNKHSAQVAKSFTTSSLASAHCERPHVFLQSQEPPGTTAVSSTGTPSAMRQSLRVKKNKKESKAENPKKGVCTEEPSHLKASSNSSSVSEQVAVDREETRAPGAISVSMDTGERFLIKGRLTGPECTQEFSQVEMNDTEETDLENGCSGSVDECNASKVSNTSHAGAHGKVQWWSSTCFKVVVGIAVIAAVALSIALPLSRSKSSNDAIDQNTDNMTRREIVRTLISLYSDLTAFDQAKSPQNLAFEWIVSEDSISPIGSDMLAQDVKTLMQRYALAVFFFATQGESSWITSRFWLDDKVDECEWQFLSCTALGRVSSIDTGANGNRITGSIPREIGLLSSLETMSLPRNSISHLPEELGSLSALASLHLDSNALAGSIPSVVYALSSLEVLNLGENSLTGTISPSISNLIKLESLGLYLNSLNGTLPIDSLSSVQFLSLRSNEIAGNLTEVISSLPNLVLLDLSKNDFVGSIPSSISNLQNLRDLFLGHNELSSSIPREIGLVTSLREVDLMATGLTGSIPNEIGNLTDLEALVVTLNNLSGSVPEEICELRPPGLLQTLIVDCSVDCMCCSLCQR